MRNSDLLIPEEPSSVSRSPGHRPLWRWSPESVFQFLTLNFCVNGTQKQSLWVNELLMCCSFPPQCFGNRLFFWSPGSDDCFQFGGYEPARFVNCFCHYPKISTPSSSPPPSYCLVDVTSQPIVEVLKTLLLFSSWKLRTALAIWHFRVRVVLQSCQIWWTIFLRFQWPTQPIELINNSVFMVSAMRSPSLWRLLEDLVDSAPIEHYCDGPKNQNDQQHC